MLEVKGLRKSFGSFSLEVELEVGKNEYFVLLGPNGAGKTLLIETIAGFHKPDEGRILLEGKDITFAPPHRRGVGLVPQDYALFPHFTVKENVAYGLRFRGCGEGVNQILRTFGLEKLANRYPQTLSGGEKQRVAIARALATKPKLLLLDEPLAAIDEEARSEFLRWLREASQMSSTIHVTHRVDEALELADKIGVMVSGKLKWIGPREEFRWPSLP